jgi:rubrerythrin
MLAGKGFDNIINLSGGYKGWQGEKAFGSFSQGLELFSGNESVEHTLSVAYSLEDGLCDFYMSMASKVNNEAAKDLYRNLSEIEVKHQERIYSEYTSVTEKPLSREEFVKSMVTGAVEGGLTTQEYINRFNPDLESARDITEIAMSIEAQALDLYQRASDRSKDARSKKALAQLADEERAHLKQLGKLMESI